MESHLPDDLAVQLLSSLSRGAENVADLAPGDPSRPSCSHGVNDLTLTTCTSQRSTLKEVFLHRALLTFAGFVLLETLGELVGVHKDFLDRSRVVTAVGTEPLCGRLGRVLSLGGLFGNAEHRSDLRPAAVSPSRRPNGFGEFLVDLVALFGQTSDDPQHPRVGKLQICRIDAIGPLLECRSAVGSCLAHFVHQPFKNFSRAFIA